LKAGNARSSESAAVSGPTHVATHDASTSAAAAVGASNVYSLDGVMFVEWNSVNLYAPSTVDIGIVQNNRVSRFCLGQLSHFDATLKYI
jgi:hypothetical protein